jgi:hypothetical protein
LLREGNKLSSGDEMSGFDGSCSRESPARSAVSLILHSINCTLGDPVNTCRVVGIIKPSDILMRDVVIERSEKSSKLKICIG